MPTDSTPSGQLPLDGMGTKFCIGCGETKPLTDYYITKNGKPYGRCKPCTCEQQRKNKIIHADPVLFAERERKKLEPLIAAERTCTGCLRLLPSEMFPRRFGKPELSTARCKECVSARGKAHYNTHTEELDAKRALWTANGRENRLECTRRWRAKNLEHRREYNRRWNAEHRQVNIDRVTRWVQENPEKAREQRRLRKARKNGSGGNFSEADWERLKAQYDWRCLACGVQEPEVALQADHVVPLAMGGFNIISNIQPLCPFHNNSKWKRFIDYRPSPYGLKKGL